MIRKLLLRLKYRNIKFKKEGKGCLYKGFSSVFKFPEKITLGDNVHLGKNTEIDAAGFVDIGTGVIFAPDVCVYSRSHNFKDEGLGALPFDNRFKLAKVVIKDYVWVGRRVIILPGVTIGKAAVIGAGTVVSKDVPDYGVAVGNPAKVIKYRDRKTVEDILRGKTPFVYDKFGHKKIFV